MEPLERALLIAVVVAVLFTVVRRAWYATKRNRAARQEFDREWARTVQKLRERTDRQGNE